MKKLSITAGAEDPQMTQVRTPNQPVGPGGFTMIELMIAIVIIAILIGLLVPATQSAIRRARVTGVKHEISQLETAVSKFKADHGIEPPSMISLYETGTVNAASGTGWNNDAKSRGLIQQIWPQFNFAIDRDINGDGIVSAPGQINLTVGECLVFFLGGVNGNATPAANANNNIAGNIGACTGFSKDPTNPFARGGTREPPLYEFLPARFKDLDSDGFPEYVDNLPSQTSPYLYYSSYDGLGYQESTEFGGGGLTLAYRQGPNLTDAFWKPNSFQIISPGYDKAYGFGGGYIPNATVKLPPATSPPPSAAQRIPEADNITNFSQGELQP